MTGNKLLAPLAAAALAAAALSLAAGPAGPAAWDIVAALRLPRTLAALLAGAGLGLAGALFQGVLKNPLADPYLLGTSAGATAAAVLCFLAGIDRASPLFFALVFAGAFSATLAAYWLARLAGGLHDASLVLAGVAVSSFLSAALLLALGAAREKALPLFGFVMGALYPAEPAVLAACAAVLLAAAAPAWLRWRALDALSLGEERGYHLGADPARLRLLFFALACLATAAAVSLGGTIGFAGLMTPHIVRLLGGASARRLLPASLLAGAALVTAGDAAGRLIMPPAEIPAGVMMALCGAPFFMWLLWRGRRGDAA